MKLTGYLGDSDLVLEVSDEDILEIVDRLGAGNLRQIIPSMAHDPWLMAFGLDDGTLFVEKVAFWGLTTYDHMVPLTLEGVGLFCRVEASMNLIACVREAEYDGAKCAAEWKQALAARAALKEKP